MDGRLDAANVGPPSDPEPDPLPLADGAAMPVVPLPAPAAVPIADGAAMPAAPAPAAALMAGAEMPAAPPESEAEVPPPPQSGPPVHADVPQPPPPPDSPPQGQTPVVKKAKTEKITTPTAGAVKQEVASVRCKHEASEQPGTAATMSEQPAVKKVKTDKAPQLQKIECTTAACKHEAPQQTTTTAVIKQEATSAISKTVAPGTPKQSGGEQLQPVHGQGCATPEKMSKPTEMDRLWQKFDRESNYGSFLENCGPHEVDPRIKMEPPSTPVKKTKSSNVNPSGCEHPAGSGAMMLEPGVPDVAAAVGQTLGEEGYYKCLLVPSCQGTAAVW